MKPLPPRPVPCTHAHTAAHHCCFHLPPNTKGFPNKAGQEHNPTDTPSEVTQSTRNLPKSGAGSHQTQHQSGETHKSSLVRKPFLFAHRSLLLEKYSCLPPLSNLLSKAEFSFSKLPPLSPKCWDLLSTVTSAGNSKGAHNYCIKPTSNAFTHKMPNFLPGSSLPRKSWTSGEKKLQSNAKIIHKLITALIM